jgi:hypothetical protein
MQSSHDESVYPLVSENKEERFSIKGNEMKKKVDNRH